MKKISYSVILILMMMAGSVFAGRESCCKNVVSSARWVTSFQQAKQLSAQKGLPIFAVFTGSDWCPYCIKLRQEVFSKPEFQNFVKDKFILLKIDFPKNKCLSAETLQQNRTLAKRYEVKMLPEVMILDSKGNFILKSGYRKGGCKTYIAFLKIAKKLARIYSDNEPLQAAKKQRGDRAVAINR